MSIALRPGTGAARLNREKVLTCREGCDEPIADCGRAIAIDPVDAESCFQRGITHIELGRYPGAVEDLNRAVRLDPTHTFAESGCRVARGLAGGDGAL